VVDALPEREALVAVETGGPEVRLTFAELDERINRLASSLADAGMGAGDHVGIGLYNGNHYVEAMLALYKLRAVPVNINYRYGAEELRYLFADADLKVVVVEPELVERVGGIQPELPQLERVMTGDELEELIAAGSRSRPDATERTSNDLYLIYTGGTTGMPKGVMWRHEDIFFAAMGGAGAPSFGLEPLREPALVGEWASTPSALSPRLPLCPLMHGGAMWLTLQALLRGETCVLSADRHFDPGHALELMAAERVAMIMVIGDAVMRPIAERLAADPSAYDLSGLRSIASGGAILSPSVKDQLASLLPNVRVSDLLGASESGGQGRLVNRDGAGPPRLRTDDRTALFDDELRIVAPEAGSEGRLGRRGYIPYGYYKDPDKSARTFPVIDGVRWSVPGDRARYEADGAISLLGREAAVINTGGEKVYAEEVEAVLKDHPAIHDALVVGTPDDRFGQRVTAVVDVRSGHDWPGDEAVSAWTHERISGYKVPRAWVLVEGVHRLPTGKPDYGWARDVARGATDE
jgi:acyl-CoA synthetase (AMP-forming)/AMP-acid ligase II